MKDSPSNDKMVQLVQFWYSVKPETRASGMMYSFLRSDVAHQFMRSGPMPADPEGCKVAQRVLRN